ncbi:hypothetical protein JK361_35305 [Streptomyces sp. 5-8]|uniref:DUF6879 domain-containing protein n=1 Tax=Streptomyces musisoli TaxID=2802280 RepID=A0ABS1PCK0_9ACTN|nr:MULTISPECIES: DUF6879 family protein [Streptomyces]MBL1109780.1 hypothetical protein [Streptomyces musisoli]MBY8846751.1 hypothetical protein [Streptomyces sp. SP2-10]
MRLLVAVVAAVLCAGTVLMVRVTASVVSRLNDLRQAVDRRFADISAATRLFAQVEKLRGDGVPRLVDAAEALSAGPGILREFVYAEIDRLAAHLENLTDSVAECPGENHDWLLTLTRCTRKSIDAVTTTVVDDYSGSTGSAGRYLAAQGEAIERGASVRRLFVVQRSAQAAALVPLCTAQRQVGVQVRVAVLEKLPPSLRRGAMTDFVVFDGALSYEVDFDPLGSYCSTRIDAHAHRVEPFVSRFDLLWNATEPADS